MWKGSIVWGVLSRQWDRVVQARVRSAWICRLEDRKRLNRLERSDYLRRSEISLEYTQRWINVRSWVTLILLGVPNARWGDVTRREIPTEHNHFRNEVHFYTVVKHFSDPPQRGGVIQPHVRENKEVEVGKLLFDPNYISRLDDCRLSAVRTHQMEDCVRLPVVSSPPSLGSLCDRKWIWT